MQYKSPMITLFFGTIDQHRDCRNWFFSCLGNAANTVALRCILNLWRSRGSEDASNRDRRWRDIRY